MRTPAHPWSHAPGRLIFCAVLAVALAACGSKSTGGGATDGGTDGGPVGGTDGGTTGSISGPGVYGGLPGQPAEARAVDPANPDNAVLDTDCDGISDADEFSATYDDGAGTSKHTEAANPDTDGDGLPDGLESGRTQVIEPSRCTSFFKPDLDSVTTTNPVNADTDGDGVRDGVEDLNQDGHFDNPGEGDPNSASSQGTTTVVNACSDANLVQVVFDRSQPADVQLATVGFTEKLPVTVGGVEKGWLYWNPTRSVGAFALEKATVEADVAAMEAAGQSAFAAMGAVTNPLVQTFTTWDAYPGMKATYNWAAAGDAKTIMNTIATTFAGSGASQWSGTAGGPGPWVLRVEYVRRSGNTADIVGAFARPSDYANESVAMAVDDVMNGSAFAQSDDTGSVQCEAFQRQAYSKLDILWVVDNSGSMANDQEAVRAASAQMMVVLGRSPVDWRMALVTTSYYVNTHRVVERDLKQFTRDPSVFASWFTRATPWASSTDYVVGARVSNSAATNDDQDFLTNYVCTDGGESSSTGLGPHSDRPPTTGPIADGGVEWHFDPTWVGTAGTGTEKALLAAKNAIDEFRGAGELRSDAKLVVIFLSDTDDQAYPSGATHCGGGYAANNKDPACNDISTYVSFFNNYDGQGSKALAHGILCRDLVAGCSDMANLTHRVQDLVNHQGGVLGSIKDFAQGTNAIDTLTEIVRDAAGATSPYHLSKAPISASFKVALEGDTVGVCPPVVGSTANIADVPRSRTDGFDYYAPTNSILFYGNCRPSAGQVALSYRYWVPGNCPADGCSADCSPTCQERQLCIHETNTCVWPADCGGICQPDETCDTSNGTCRSNRPG